ncbi:unnamed protein product [Zymoseptoria tritici ST99CH_1A5]|uniref:Uncharacterized protein n=1 Tax=Zymoseptoria tritici ST99CH_1A5 TaxID=1276529 RepID=A0A1Y6LCG9_ZYMTR|nr:unnamed protein product [Zymoseptoria tritici ST99CH_1A5]
MAIRPPPAELVGTTIACFFLPAMVDGFATTTIIISLVFRATAKISGEPLKSHRIVLWRLVVCFTNTAPEYLLHDAPPGMIPSGIEMWECFWGTMALVCLVQGLGQLSE